VTPETICPTAIGVLLERGRCRTSFTDEQGRVDRLGALALAAGFEPQVWLDLRQVQKDEDLTPDQLALVEAARLVAHVEAPCQDPHLLPLDRLVMLVGDGEELITDGQACMSLAKATALAEQAGART
jgi:hypothetical protein